MTTSSSFFALTVFACAVLASVSSGFAADERDRFEARTYKDANGFELKYRLLTPQNYDASKQYPLVLFLHGAGERGSDNKKQLVHGMKDFASDNIMEKYPCFVIAPQCPSGKRWVEVDWGRDTHDMPEKPSEPLRAALQLVASLPKSLSIDKSRLYITGLSMGGFGTWDAIQRHPDKFAAAVPICGGGDEKQAKQIAGLPIWVFHGDKDGAVKVKRSRNMVQALKDNGGTPKYTEYPNVGHNSWSATYRDPKMYKWLFAQRRAAGTSKK